MSRSLEEIRNSNKREESLISTKVEDKEIDEDFINQVKDEFENFVKPVRDRVYNRYLKEVDSLSDLNDYLDKQMVNEEFRKEYCNLDEYAIDGLFTDSEANTELKNLRIRDLIDWCERNNKDISKLQMEEIMKFINKK